MSGTPLVESILTSPSYGLPLVLAGGIAAGLAWWAHARTRFLPTPGTGGSAEPGMNYPDSVAHAALAQGRYLPALNGLWVRLAAVTWSRVHVRIEHRDQLDSPTIVRALPPSVRLPILVRNLYRAYCSAWWAGQPSWLASQWTWLQRRQQAQAEQRFVRVVADLSTAFRALEASG